MLKVKRKQKAKQEHANAIAEQQAQGKVVYTKLVQNLSQEGKQSGKQWLKSIAENVRNVFAEEIKKGK